MELRAQQSSSHPVLDAFRRPATAFAVVTAMAVSMSELAGCSADNDTATESSTTAPVQGPSVVDMIPHQPSQPAQAANIWAGYVAMAPENDQYTAVSGSFTVPEITCDNTDPQAGMESVAQWVGIDGYGNATVEQIGINATCVDQNTDLYGDKGQVISYGPHDYQPSYNAWAMNYGGGTYSEVLDIAIHPGDQIDTSVTYVGNDQFEMYMRNVSTGQSYTETAVCEIANVGGSCERAMAEWIIERAGNSALGEFDTATFTGATATLGSSPGQSRDILELSGFPVDMVQNGNPLAITSGISPDGGAFSVYYQQHGVVGD